MKLYYSKTSPFARKVLVTVIEKNLLDQTELVLANPFGEADELQYVNPLGKIPTLVVGEMVLFDSPVICEYLDAINRPWLESSRFNQLCQAALADGVIDAALAIVLENRRKSDEKSPLWIERQQNSILRSLPVMQQEIDNLHGDISFAHVAFGCALGYLDFRLPGLDWRVGHADLAEWYYKFAQRPSMLDTIPPVS